MGIYCLDSLNCISFSETYNERRFVNKSSDGGKTWNLFSEFDYSNDNDPIDKPSRVFIYDSTQMYSLFYDGLAINKSTDGGRTFKSHLFGELSKIDDLGLDNLHMFDKNRGFAISSGWLFSTEDNWETHKVIDIPNENYLDGIMFIIDSNNVAFMCYNFLNERNDYISELQKYDFLANEWSSYSLFEKRREDSRNSSVNSFSKVNDSLIYACGHLGTGIADYNYDLVWKSTDNGKSWEKIVQHFFDYASGLLYISFRTEKHGIAVGNWSNIIETTDGGKSWFQFPRVAERRGIGSEITWAGSTALYTTSGRGIFRLEKITGVEELTSDEKFRVYQSGRGLEIAINDESYAKYEFRLYNSSGLLLQSSNLSSNFGFVFESVGISILNNGVYFYTISNNSSIEFTGNLVVVE